MIQDTNRQNQSHSTPTPVSTLAAQLKRWRAVIGVPAVFLLSFTIFGCARGAGESEVQVTGYTAAGTRLTAKTAGSGELCPATNSYFAARCEDSGLKVISTSECAVLCSGPVDL